MIFDELRPGRTTHKELIRSYRTDIRSKKYLYLVGGIYGDQVEGICILERLFQWMSNDHKLVDLPIVVIPILNVDGYQFASSVNAEGINLYQDFNEEIESPENQYLIKILKKYPPSKFLSFGSSRPPSIEFCAGGKKLANLLAKINFFDLKKLEIKEGSLPAFLNDELESHFIAINFPKITDQIGLESIWENNKKHLQELIKSEVLYEAYR
jgi:protein MpaA